MRAKNCSTVSSAWDLPEDKAMNRREKEIARRFDGETDGEHPNPLSADLAAYDAGLRLLRKGAQNARQRPEIADAQFPAFMQGIQESIEAPRRGHRGFWAVVSLSTAALLVAMSAFVIFMSTNEHKTSVVEAVTTEVETVSTDINGATVDSYTSGDGTTVVWVSTEKRDLL
jgi:hypothetical protein